MLTVYIPILPFFPPLFSPSSLQLVHSPSPFPLPFLVSFSLCVTLLLCSPFSAQPPPPLGDLWQTRTQCNYIFIHKNNFIIFPLKLPYGLTLFKLTNFCLWLQFCLLLFNKTLPMFLFIEKGRKKAYLKLKNLENLKKLFSLSLSAYTSNHNPRINSTLSPTNQLLFAKE